MEEKITPLTGLVKKVKEAEPQDFEELFFESFQIGSPVEDEFRMLMQEVTMGLTPITLASLAYGLTRQEAFWLMAGLSYGGLFEFNMPMLHFKGELFREARRKEGMLKKEKMGQIQEQPTKQ